jgi:glucan phosphoethanolaminetransferase (alkaline phosphatase superfamily)
MGAKFSLRALGEPSQPWGSVAAVTLFLLFFSASKKSFYGVVLPLALIAMLYGPVGYVYGRPDFQAIISLLATNLEESADFLSLIPFSVYLHALYVPLFCLLAFFIASRVPLKPWKNKTVILLSLAVLICAVKPTQFVDQLRAGLVDVKKAQDELNRFISRSSWGKSETAQEAKDYVLVIGESARRDYFGVYGYPVPNTPFLAKTPATVVDGMTSAGVYTIGSLSKMLTLPDKKKWTPNYDLNLIDLAKSAGIRTVWLSNQGYTGTFDTAVSAIGNRADKSQFLNKGDFEHLNLSDFELLRNLKEELKNAPAGKRLIVLHTMGSHPDICRRVLDMKDQYRVTDRDYETVACYVSSVKKTDRFLERLVGILKANQKDNRREFSVVYFSDHGMRHIKKFGRSIRIDNNGQSKLHYEIPLVKIDSDGAERKLLKSGKSGLNFTEGLARWMGIRNERLGKYDLFDGRDDPDDYGLKGKIEAITAPLDPAVDISGILKK